jgi:hypothetical protein
MEGAQYDLFLFLLDEYELRKHRAHVESLQRLARHQGATADDYSAELEAIALEESRRAEEARNQPPDF